MLLDPAETGAVTLSLHQDVQAEAYDFPDELLRAARPGTVSRRPPADGELRAAVAALRARRAAARDRRRRRALLGGAARAGRLSERCGLPVAETSAGKGALPDGALAMGGIGVTGTRAANALAREADLVLHVGTRLIDLTTGLAARCSRTRTSASSA